MSQPSTFILAEPNASTTVEYQLPAAESVKLNFASSDIDGLRINENGGLEISLIQGGEVTLSNFQSYVDGGNTLFLADDIMVDPALLQSGLASQVLAEAANDNRVEIGIPAEGVTREITLEPGKDYVFTFDMNAPKEVTTENGQFTMGFENGGKIILTNYDAAMASADAPSITMESKVCTVENQDLITTIAQLVNGEVVEAEEIVIIDEDDQGDIREEVIEVVEVEPAAGEEQQVPRAPEPEVEEVAMIEPEAGEEVINIEPAAGGDEGNTGYGFNSAPGSAPFQGIPYIGPINPTALQYTAPELTQLDPALQTPTPNTITPTGITLTSPPTNTLDESNFDQGDLVGTGTVVVDFGSDGPAATDPIRPNGSFSADCSVNNNILASGGVPVVTTATATGYEGYAGNTLVFEFVLDTTTGAYTYTQYEPFDHADGSDPDDEICLHFGIIVEDGDGDTAETEVVVDVLDDAPFVINDIHDVDETNLGPIVIKDSVTFEIGADVPGVVLGNDTFSASGSLLNNTLTSNGETVVVTYDSNNRQYTGTANGQTIFTLNINTDGAYTFQLLGPLDHADGNDPDDVIVLNFGFDAEDYDGDVTSGTITVNVADDAPSIESAQETVDETDLGPVVVSGQVTGDYGQDGAGSFAANGDFDSSGSQLNGALTHNGTDVIVTYDSNTGTYTGDAGGTTVFTMVVNSDGTYEFTLLETLDHADPNDPNDIINLDFGVEIIDYDGDSAQTTIRVRVKDDVPTIGNSAGNVDESNFDTQDPLIWQDVIDTDFGQDLGSVSPGGGTFEAKANGSPISLTSNGTAVVVTETTDGYEGYAGTTLVFTLEVDPTTGAYTYTQYETLDHPDTADHDDIIELCFPVEVVSVDQETDTGLITISVADDGPVANDDINGAEESQFITGDVTANDEPSEDEPNTVTNVQFNGTDYTVPSGGSVTVTGAYGVLVMNSDGTYEYTANSNDPDGTDVFTYTLEDGDGDTDTATLSITVTPDGEPVAVSEFLAVDETNLTPGPLLFNDTINVDFGIDGAGTIYPNDSFASSGSLLNNDLTSNGVDVVVTATSNGYEGYANGTLVFSIEVQDTGDYTFQLFEPLDHADGTDPNDVIHLTFGITIEDADGDTADGEINVLVYDDAPVAHDDFSGGEEDDLIEGNVLHNDELSEDIDNTVIGINYKGVDYTVGSSFTTDYGTMTINSDGSWAYQVTATDPDGTDLFTYTLQDGDGDTDTAELSIRVTPQGDPIVVSGEDLVDETDLENGPVTVSGDIDIDGGVISFSDVSVNGNFSVTGSATTLTHQGVTIDVTAKPDGSGYTATAGSVDIFDLTLNDDGTYEFTLYNTIDHGDDEDPNDTVQVGFEFGITVTDPAGEEVDGVLKIDILDDGPVAYDDGAYKVNEGETYTGNVTDNDELSEDEDNTVTAVIFNGTEYAVASSGDTTVTGTYGTLTINALGEYSYLANSNNPDGTDVFTYVLRDYDGDTDTADLTFTVCPDDDPILVQPEEVTTDETDLGPIVVTDKLEADFGNDGPGTFAGTDTFTFGGSTAQTLTSCGHEVSVTYNTQTGTYTGTANGQTIFTLVIESDGDYTFTQTGVLDHADANDPNDMIYLDFGVEAEDADGDKDTGTIRVNVYDDGPVVESKFTIIDETDLDGQTSISVSDTIDFDFGNDGAGSLEPNNDFIALFQMNGQPVTLESQGRPITVTQTANGYVGTVNGGNTTIFTLTLNSQTGQYTYTQFDQIDHPDPNNPNDVIWLKFGVEVTDCDGDSDNGYIIIDVHDDGPKAVNDTIGGEAGGSAITGNVTDNDDVGTDEDGKVINVNFNGTNYAVPSSGNVTINGTYGTLKINSTGAYTYTPTGNNNAQGTDVFTYTLEDYDGDTDTAKLIVNIEKDGQPVVTNGEKTVDESNLNLNVTGGLDVNYNGDGPGTVTGDNRFEASGRTGGTLKSNGANVNVTFNASNNTYTGTAGGKTVFKLKVNADGSYRYEQFKALDHNDPNDPNEIIKLKFGVTATDKDGDTDQGWLTINVKDDAPNAKNDTFKNDLKDNVLKNDSFGEDGKGELTRFKVGNKWYDSGKTINTSLGKFTLDDNGHYQLTDRKTTVSSKVTSRTYIQGNVQITEITTTTTTTKVGGTLKVTYEIKDFDKDADTALLTVNLDPVESVSVQVRTETTWIGDRGDGAGDGDGDGTPLVLDLDGDGVELTTKDNGVSFDIDNDGIAEKTAWAAPDDALLALDRNSDGVINDQTELFGDTDEHADGFANLASYDENGDGIISAEDEIFNDLIVWQDRNQDGVSDTNEMLTLAQIGIVSINLNAEMPDDLYIEGNWISHVSSYMTADGQTYDIVDAWFKYENVDDDMIVNMIDVAANEIVSGTDGADHFMIEAAGEFAASISNFNVEENDSLDLSHLLEGQDDITDAINAFVFARVENGDTIISIDQTGSGDVQNAQDICRLKDKTDINIEDLVQDGNLVV